MTLRTTVMGIRPKTAFHIPTDNRVHSLEAARKEKRSVYFDGGFQECSEANDMANGFYHPQTGEVIAQGRLGLPTFIGVMQFTAKEVIKEVERLGNEKYRKGNILVL
jgi:hypothetical protein